MLIKKFVLLRIYRWLSQLKYLSIKTWLIGLCLGFFTVSSSAQLNLSLWGDAGDSQIDKNGYTSLSGQVSFQKSAYKATLSYSTLFTHWKETVANGLKFSIERQNKIQNFDFGASLFYLHKPISNELFEWNFGLLLSKAPGNWHLNLGVHYREIRLKSSVTQDYSDGKIIEGLNLLYLAGYSIPFHSKNWDFQVALTNYDHFLLLQETNPMMNISVGFTGLNKLNLFSEFWYRTAGFNNIQVHYFGYFFRMGAIWQINW